MLLANCTARAGAALTMILLAGLALAQASAEAASPAAVTVTEDANLYTLDNGIVTARVAKVSGDLVSLRYKDLEMMATFMDANDQPDLQRDPPGANPNGLNRGMTDHQYGFWSHDAMGRRGTEAAVAQITIDPAANGGQLGEVSVKGLSEGTRRMGTGPGASPQGDIFADVEIRYALGRGDSGVYTYCIFEHKPEYPATSITEARFCCKLNDFFDWMLVDAKRNKLYTKEDYENKYNYTSNQFEHPAFGWASTTKNVGCLLVNASMEYMSGGPTKVEFLCHRDTNQVAAPCVLNYWRSSHYGGATVAVAQGEHWTKVIGPLLIYCNSGADPQMIYADALAQQAQQSAKWPLDWVEGVDYPKAAERGAVRGRLVLTDPLAPQAKMSGLRVGLVHPPYSAGAGGFGGPRQTTWQTDAKYYQFWVRGEDDGRFVIPNVRPGEYTLCAFATGVLGEYAKADVAVTAGETLDLGQLAWTPVRRGRQLWDIGIPNRDSSEFLKGDDYFHDGMQALYAELFPNDVNFVVGKSDFRTDIYYQHVPHAAAAPAGGGGAARGGFPGFGGGGNGRATPWAITFDMPAAAAQGKATLRVAISGTGARSIGVTVNDQSVGQIPLAGGDSTFGGRNGIQGIWYERELAFDASLLKAGSNVLTLTVPAGSINSGVMYDYLRLELDESAPP